MSASKTHSELSFVEKLDLLLTGAEKGNGAMSYEQASELEAQIIAEYERLVEQLEVAEIRVRDITALNSSLAEATAGWKIRAEELQEQFDSALAALREIAYPETRERKDAGIVLARQALAGLESSPASEPKEPS